MPQVDAATARIFPTKGTRGMWVWTTASILDDPASTNIFINEAIRCGVTQVFLYLTAAQYAPNTVGLKKLLSVLHAAGITAYGMEGWRGYFSDADGPSGLFEAIFALRRYNATAKSQEKFVGFMTDMEPQDGQGVGTSLFHNGVAESQLTTAQRADRDRLMCDWLHILAAVRALLTPASLRFAASLPSWTDNYYGEPVLATYNGVTQDVTRFLMAMVDDYCVMSYNTNPQNVESRIVTKLQYAATLAHAPRIFGSVETHVGAGVNVSYGDTPPKNTKLAVVDDLDTVFTALNKYAAFAGMNIHDWVGWAALTPASTNASATHPAPHPGSSPHPCGWWP